MTKLAEALVERKSLQQQFARLGERLKASARVQEGDSPDESPAALLEEARQVLNEIKRLTIQINRTNMLAGLPEGRGQRLTMMEAIAERDRLHGEKTLLEQLSSAARVEPTRSYVMTRNEVKWRATVDVAAMQKQIDAVSKDYRLLDTRIQEANWLNDLIQN
jgi:histidyl-tRNA synthetase